MRWQRWLLPWAWVILLAACSEIDTESEPAISTVRPSNTLAVYKSESCGCCKLWMEHLQQSAFTTIVHHPVDLDAEKAKWGIPVQARSCHTAVSAEGFVFEGHVPAKFIQRFLLEKPANGKGLLVPGMPLGSPGMEYHNQFMPYDILLLKQDGSTEVYAHVSTYDEQF